MREPGIGETIALYVLIIGGPIFLWLMWRYLRFGIVDMWLRGAKDRKKARNARQREKFQAEVNRKKEDWTNRTQPLRDAAGSAVKQSPPPPPPTLVRDQPWRRPTAIRFLEELKDELVGLEDAWVTTHAQVKKAYEEARHNSPGILRAASYGLQMTALTNAPKEIEKLTARIENVYRGDVQAEIIDLEIEINKAERVTPQDDFVQHSLIELRAALKELQSLKTSNRAGGSEDDQKMDVAKQRLKRDIHFDVQSRLGKKIDTLAEIQNFEKEQMRAVLADRTLSPDEQEERIELVKRECARMKKELTSQVNIYEED